MHSPSQSGTKSAYEYESVANREKRDDQTLSSLRLMEWNTAESRREMQIAREKQTLIKEGQQIVSKICSDGRFGVLQWIQIGNPNALIGSYGLASSSQVRFLFQLAK
ncbi:hypothetical protein [Methylomonas sp. MgM2]